MQPDRETVERAQQTLSVSRAAKAIFLGPDGELTEAGRIFLDALAFRCRWRRSVLDRSVYDDEGRMDPLAVVELASRRDVYQWILDRLEADDGPASELAAIAGGEG